MRLVFVCRTDKNDIPSLGNTLAPRYQHAQREQNNRIYIGGLIGPLATLTQQDIRQFFSPFGQIDAIELPKDPYSGNNRGHSIVEFSSHKEARIAAQSMNGFEVMDSIWMASDFDGAFAEYVKVPASEVFPVVGG